ncbi:MAG: hypothetical protein ABI705_04505 [Aestuariivirga sp.]
MSYDLNPKLKKFFAKSEEDEPSVAFIRDFAKAFFDFLRSLLVVGGLKYLSVKTGNPYLSAAYWVSQTVLLLLAQGYIVSWNLKIFVHFSRTKVGEALDLILNVLLGISLWVFSYYLITVAVDAIVKSQ